MQNKTPPSVALKNWLTLLLAILLVILLTSCSLDGETPAVVAPRVTEAVDQPASPAVITATASSSITPPLSFTPTPRRTATPTPSQPTATLTPTATAPHSFTRQSDTLPSPTATDSPSPLPSPALSVPCVTGANTPNLRVGPGSGYELITTLPAGTTLAALKCASDGSWLLVETTRREIGWVSTAALSCQGDLTRLPIAVGVAVQTPAATPPAGASPPSSGPAVEVPPTPPPPSPVPTPASPAISRDSWRAEYYDNASLLGQPVLVRTDPELDFNWILDSPAPGIPADNFSARWTRQFEFTEAGDYKFFADADDGVKIYIDGWLIVDQWNTDLPTLHAGTFADIKPGLHTVVVEYFESGGHARIKVWGEKTTLVEAQWIGEYYNNLELRDPAFMVRQDETITFDWGNGAPASGMNGNEFSVRWHRTVYLEGGDYEFRAEVAERDRVKIYLDDWLVAEEYEEESGIVRGSFGDVGAGHHTIKVEYQEYTGRASIKFRWEKD